MASHRARYCFSQTLSRIYSTLMEGCIHGKGPMSCPRLLNSAMSSACVPACFCLFSMARSRAQRPGDPTRQATPPCVEAMAMAASLSVDWSSVPHPRQIQAGSAAVWSLEGRQGSAKAKGPPSGCPAHLLPSSPAHPTPSSLTSPGSVVVDAAGPPSPASVAARGL